MINKKEPKLNEVIESLYKQLVTFKKDIEKGNDTLERYISSLSDIKIEFNLDRYSEIKKQNNIKLEKLLYEFEESYKADNLKLIARIRKSTLVQPVYIMLTIILLLLTTGLSLYNVAMKSNKIQNVESYFLENPDAAKHYRNWDKD